MSSQGIETPDLVPFIETDVGHRRHRLELMGIGPADESVVETVHEHVVRPETWALIDQFYEFLLGQPEMRPFIDDAATLERLKQVHATYLTSFGREFDTAGYFEYRLRIGLTHLRIGLPLHLYLAAYRQLQSLLLAGLRRSCIEGPDLLVECADVIGKFVHLDLSLAIDAYNSSQIETFSQSIDELETEKHRLSVRLMFDSLTRTYSRDYILDHLKTLLAGPARNDQKTLAVGLLDLDGFKGVNDTYGHQVGDAVLGETARLIQKDIRSQDMLGRYGGEEFLLILLADEEAQARDVAERIRARVAGHLFAAGGDELSVTISIGLSMARPDDTVAGLISRADEAVYLAKSSGRNQTKVV